PTLTRALSRMDWTDMHFRQLARLLSRRTWLWTEMVVDKTILHTQNLDKFLWFPPEQRPLVLQLGGSDPATLAAAAARAVEYGYDEINLNCGCPSDRVASAGCFGAALMMRPHLVARCTAAMAEAMKGDLRLVMMTCYPGGRYLGAIFSVRCCTILTARSPPPLPPGVRPPWVVQGLSPHQNRTVPPLRHQWAWALARDFPHLQFSLNGGVLNCHEARFQGLSVGGNGGGIVGVMIGRGAYNDPWGCLADADRAVYGEPYNPAPSRRWVIERYREYAESMVGRYPDGHADPSIRTLMRPLLNLFHGEPGCKRWKNEVDELL
ncbi:hypothetical protein VOLCADRAFT_43118, partial [Volvox carteri f. nagariensis]